MLPEPGNWVSKGVHGFNLPITNSILFFPSCYSALPFINCITKNFHVTGAGRYVHGQRPFAGWEMVCMRLSSVLPPAHLAPKRFLFPPPKMKHNPLLPSLQASAEQRPRVFFWFCYSVFSAWKYVILDWILKKKMGEEREIPQSHQGIFISWTVSP